MGYAVAMKKKKELRVTTKTGDKGESSLWSGERRRKDDLVFETLGTLDELNAHLGMVKASLGEGSRWQYVDELQGYLMGAAGRAASLGEAPAGGSAPELKKAAERVEAVQEELAAGIASPEGFVRPGKDLLSARTHVARAVCRRSERMVVRCIEAGRTDLSEAQVLLNRMADLLFVLALAAEEGV
jgi:cob(I)alamin adenosyltransferase